MRLSFRATEAAFEAGDDALVCGVSDGRDMYLMFQRTPESMIEDEGIYLEHRDQINSGYGCIRHCRLSRAQLSVELSRQLGKLVGVEGFDVRLDVEETAYTKLSVGLQRIFRDQVNALTVA